MVSFFQLEHIPTCFIHQSLYRFTFFYLFISLHFFLHQSHEIVLADEIICVSCFHETEKKRKKSSVLMTVRWQIWLNVPKIFTTILITSYDQPYYHAVPYTSHYKFVSKWIQVLWFSSQLELQSCCSRNLIHQKWAFDKAVVCSIISLERAEFDFPTKLCSTVQIPIEWRKTG